MARFLKWIGAFFAALAIGCGVAFGVKYATHSQMAPKIVVSQKFVEFGQVVPGQEETAFVTIQNRGRATLAIRDVRVSCGCVSVTVDDPSLAPDASTKLTINASGRRSVGVAQHHIVTILSNDPRQPREVIEVRIRGAPTVGFVPNEVDFGRIETLALPLTETIALYLDESSFAHVEEAIVESTIPFVSCQVTQKNPKNKALTVLVALGDHSHVGEITGRLKVRFPTLDREQSANIVGCVVGPYYADPPALVVGPIRRADAANSRPIRVQARDSNRFRIIGVECGDQLGDGLIASTSGDSDCNVLFTWHPAKFPQPWSARRVRSAVQIAIVTNDGERSTLNVPVELLLED